MGAVTGEPGAPPAAATETLASLQVREADARASAADRARAADEDEAAKRSIAFSHEVAGRTWTVHVASSTAANHLVEETFAGTPTREDQERWVADNRAMLARAAEAKIAAGAVTDNDVWVHSRDFV